MLSHSSHVAQLAQFCAIGLLTFVWIPETDQDQERDMLSSRQRLLVQQIELSKHIQS